MRVETDDHPPPSAAEPLLGRGAAPASGVPLVLGPN